MTKAGYFDYVADSLELYSPKRIIEETGYQNLNIHILAFDEKALSPDESLFQCAVRSKWPVVTEDLGIIRQLARQQTRYFNALMMLEFVFFKALICPEEYAKHLQKLLAHAWYSSEIVEFGEIVHQMLEESG
jgi:hypothetical protein